MRTTHPHDDRRARRSAPTVRRAAALALSALLGSACGGTTQEAASARTGDGADLDHAAFCDASVATGEAALGHDLEAVAAGMASMADASPDPALAELLLRARDLLVEDPEAAFASEVMAQVQREHDQQLSEQCGARRADIEGLDFSYGGVEDLPAGRTLLALDNVSEEHHHEAMVARRTDDGTMPIADVLALGPEGAMAHLEIVGAVDAAPGQVDLTLVDLVPGTYVYLCAVPLDESDPGAPMHVQLGMFDEFEVLA